MKKTIVFPYLGELRAYLLRENEHRKLAVRHNKYGLGEIQSLRRVGDTSYENIVVRFVSIGNEISPVREFSFPLCFLKGYLKLEAGWENIVKHVQPLPVQKKEIEIQPKGEEVTEEDVKLLKNYLSVQTSKPHINVYYMEDLMCKDKGSIISYESNLITVSTSTCIRCFHFPDDFVKGRLRLQEGTKEMMKKYLKLNLFLVPPANHEIEEKMKKISKVTLDEGKNNVQSKKIIRADTNAEFLNKIFGTNYRQWYKSVWKESPNRLVWMVRFYDSAPAGKATGNGVWENRWCDKEHMRCREEYKGSGIPNEPETDYRIVVSIEERNVPRRYTIEGVYKWDKTKGDLYIRYYDKVENFTTK